MVTSENTFEGNNGEFIAEASTLGFPPGQYPNLISTKLGNKMDFKFQNFDDDVAIYKQQFGSITLKVLND